MQVAKRLPAIIFNYQTEFNFPHRLLCLRSKERGHSLLLTSQDMTKDKRVLFCCLGTRFLYNQERLFRKQTKPGTTAYIWN